MDNLGPIAILVVIWIIGAMFDKKRKEERRRRAAKSRVPAPVDFESVASESEGHDPSQLEGGLLEKVLRQLDPEFADKALGKGRSLPEIEPAPQASSPVPVTTTRGSRPAADDRAAETRAIIARRLRVAEARVEGRTASDHKVFHDAIREPEKKVRKRVLYPTSAMRRAVVWREILGPPKAMTIDE